MIIRRIVARQIGTNFSETIVCPERKKENRIP